MEEHGETFILLRDKEGVKITNVVMGMFGPTLCPVLRGELAVNIPETFRKDGQLPHNYQTIFTKQEATFYDSDQYHEDSDVAPLLGGQHLLLAGVKSNEERYQTFISGKLEWGSNLKMNDAVEVSLNCTQAADTGSTLKATAVIRYVGPVKGLTGITFGLEIVDPLYFGQGTTDGTFQGDCYFSCKDGNGMFVSLDKLTELPPGGYVPELPPQLPPRGHQPATQSAGKQGDKKGGRNRATDSNVDTPRFKVQDRVVAFNNDVAIHGTVRWVGRYTLVDEKKQPYSVAAVGIETDVKVLANEMESCLPPKTHYFSIGKKKGSLFLREEEVMLEGDFAQVIASAGTTQQPQPHSGQGTSAPAQESQQPPKPHRPRNSPPYPQQPAAHPQQQPAAYPQQQYQDERQQWQQQVPTHQARDEPLNVNDRRKLAEQMGVGNPTQLMKEQSELLQKAAEEKKRKELKEVKGALDPGESVNIGAQERLFCQYSAGKRHDEMQPHNNYPLPQRVIHPPAPADPTLPAGLGIGSPVQLKTDPNHTGVIRWIGTLSEIQGSIAGVELDGPMEGCGDGEWRGHRYFACPPGRAFFCPVTSLMPDTHVPQPFHPHESYPLCSGHALASDKLPSTESHRETELMEEVKQLQKQLATLSLNAAAKEQNLQESNHQLQIQNQQQIDQLQNENGILQQQLQQEQQRSQQLQDRLDRSAGQMVNMRPATAVMMNIAFCTAQRSEVQTGAIIGEGAWGKVERGVFKSSPVAVKSIHSAILRQNTVDRLRREINIMAQVHHPNLVRFIAAVLDGRAERLQAPPLIITELLDINLRKAYEEKRVVPANYLTVLRDIAYGLHHLHSLQQPIIHRDVSSPNVLLQQQPSGGWLAKVSDFGSANFAKQAYTAGEGAIIYSAPEAFPTTVSDPDSERPLLSTKVDVYSYGVVACELVTGEMPTSERYRAMLQQVKDKWAFMHGLILRCTKRSPLDRPTMADILDELPRPIPRPLE